MVTTSASQLIVDDDLDQLLSNHIQYTPILNVAHWSLLRHVLTARPPTPAHVALLNRVPLAPILISLLNTVVDPDVARAAVPCVAVLWPLAVQKLSSDVLLDCFAALLRALQSRDTDQGLAMLTISIVPSYTNSFYGASNKSKIAAKFLQNHFGAWVKTVLRQDNERANAMLEATYHAGTETIFNLDSLRQTRAFNADSPLFQAIRSVPSSSTIQPLLILPRLFATYLETLKKYRGALFNSPPETAATELQDSGIQFYIASTALVDDGSQQLCAADFWTVKIALLALVDKEKLYNLEHRHFQSSLAAVLEMALGTLDLIDNPMTVQAIEVISILARIDYDLVLPALPRILPKILTARTAVQPCLTLLDLLLIYYTKTRTMNSYIDVLFSTFSSHLINSLPETYGLTLTGPLFEPAHLKSFSTALQRFLTNTQICQVVETTFGVLSSSWKELEAHCSLKPELKESIDAPHAAIFALSSRFASIVLNSLPLQSVAEASRQDIANALEDIRVFALTVGKKGLRRITKARKEHTSSYSVVVAAAFHLLYALNASNVTVSVVACDAKQFKKLMATLEIDDLLPELRLETIRLLISKLWMSEDGERRALIDIILQDLENSHENMAISGQLCASSLWRCTEDEYIRSLFHLVVGRWLPMMDSFASCEQLERLVRIVVITRIVHDSSSTAPSILLQTLHSAHFWELSNLRDAFLVVINETIGAFEQNQQSLRDFVSVYRLLLLVPVDYIPRSSRLELARRAVLADQLITFLPNPPETACQDVTVFRTFIWRIFSRGRGAESIQRLCDLLKYTMTSRAFADESFWGITLDLIEVLFSEVLGASEKGDLQAVRVLLRIFSEAEWSTANNLCVQSFLRMVEVLMRNFSITSLSKGMCATLRELHEAIAKQVLNEIAISDGRAEGGRAQMDLLKIWSSLLSFSRWLLVRSNKDPDLGKRLTLRSFQVSKQDRDHEYDGLLVITFDIILQEFHFLLESERPARLDLIIALYWSFSFRLEVSSEPGSLAFLRLLTRFMLGHQRLDDLLARTCTGLEKPDFAYLLQLTSKFLTTFDCAGEFSRVVDLCRVLIGVHPQGSLKQLQRFATQCINTFVAWYGLIDASTELRSKVLHFVALHCTDRPAALQSIDMGGIWILLSRLLSSSPLHDDVTTLHIFHSIITIISAFVRLRRDLVIHMLPHLGIILRQLLCCVRRPRQNLGTKQFSLAADMQPRWLNAKHPISVDEARALSRLLETLNTKTVIHHSAMHAEKAQSLAKPFSKHAGSVLMAYIEGMNDPLCIIPPDVRKELQPGLYALCDMLSDYGRDNLMATISDPGAKSTVKLLWREYETQRYIGKG